MAFTADDRLAIHEVFSLHGHLFDNGELDRLDEVFTSDVVTYEDIVVRTPDGWRIRHRKLIPRRKPLTR